jgi:ParB family chromosome partitioning protein
MSALRFVGLDTYQAAGGMVHRELFSEGEDGASLADPELLTRLVNDKLQTLATEGWKWVNVQPQTDHHALGKFREELRLDLQIQGNKYGCFGNRFPARLGSGM